MRIGPFSITMRKALALARPSGALAPLSPGGGGWWPIVRESFTGAWQQNVEISAGTAITYSAVFACVTLIAADVGKVALRLVEQNAAGIWTETESPAFSPVLRKPNRYQHIVKFIEQWITSKLLHGNTYVLKQRDQRGIVTALYILEPTRVTPLVTPDGAVYYELKRDDLSGQRADTVTVPASEIIHDTMICLWHPLIGVSPIYACGLAATQGLAIQKSSTQFFQNGSQPGGLLTAPGPISEDQATAAKAKWKANFGGAQQGDISVLQLGWKYEPLTMPAVDAQLIDQLKMSGETSCSCYHVPAFMVGIGPPPPYANIGPSIQQYYSQCLQSLFVNLEKCLDEGLGLADGKIDGRQLGTEFDPDDLIWLDTDTKTKAANEAIGSGGMSPDEARKKYYGLGPVAGGDTPYMQQQNWPLRQLAARELPTSAPPVPAAAPDDEFKTLDLDAALVEFDHQEGVYDHAA